MSHWLLKTDPETYSFDDLARDRVTAWTGVRNPQARNNLAAMRPGDPCFVYHSGKDPAIVGTARVVRRAYRDPETDDPRWVAVDIRVGKRVSRPVALAELKAHPLLSAMAVIRQSRLSVSPVLPEEWDAVLSLARARSG